MEKSKTQKNNTEQADSFDACMNMQPSGIIAEYKIDSDGTIELEATLLLLKEVMLVARFIWFLRIQLKNIQNFRSKISSLGL